MGSDMAYSKTLHVNIQTISRSVIIVVMLFLTISENISCEAALYDSLPCESPIFCYGPLLEAAQNAYIYNDSKTFVDLHLKNDSDVVLAAFDDLDDPTDPEVMANFVDSYFDGPDLEFIDWIPTDWTSDPAFLSSIADVSLREWASDLHALWNQLGRKIDPDVETNQDRYTLIYVQEPFIVPGGRFREFYYWDSYWVIKGLLISEMTETVRGMLSNFAEMVDLLGFIPNGNRIYYENRSQPPFFIPSVYEYWENTGDTKFVESLLPILEMEYQFWMTNRTIEVTKNGSETSYTLNRYDVNMGRPRPESFREDVETCMGDYEAQSFTCPVFYEAYGRKCYYLQGAHQSSSLAKYTCNNMGGAQVLVEDSLDVNYLVSKKNNHSPLTHDGYWLRCNDEAVEGQWRCEGSSNYWNSNGDQRGLWDWDTNEPNGGRNENCLVLKFNGKLGSVPCGLTTSFNVAACEITKIAATAPPLPVVTTTATATTTATPTTATPQQTLEESARICSDLASGAESGWDFSSRWFAENETDLKSIRTKQIVPVDLNSVLCLNEYILSILFALTGKTSKSQMYMDAHNKRRLAIQEIFWVEEAGIWQDYDLESKTNRNEFYPSNIMPMWANCFGQGNGDLEVEEKVLEHLKNLGVLDYPGGIPTSLLKSGQQWDFPNAWPPLQEMTIQALQNSGLTEANDYALRLAQNWTTTNWKAYEETNVMFEKYDVEKQGVPGHGGEYEVQAGFGWTNGVMLTLLDRYGDKLVAPSEAAPLAYVSYVNIVLNIFVIAILSLL